MTYRGMIAVALGLMTTACADYFERQARREEEASNAQCTSFGFTPGTAAFANCRLELAKAKIAADAVVRSAPQAPVVTAAPLPRPMSCTSMVIGNVIHTDC